MTCSGTLIPVPVMVALGAGMGDLPVGDPMGPPDGWNPADAGGRRPAVG
jgi:hypothetical protein